MSSWECVFTLNYVLSAFIKSLTVFVEIITTGFECQGMILGAVANIPYMHRSTIDVQSSMPTAKLLTIRNQACTRSSPVGMNNGTLSSMFTISRFTFCISGFIINLMESYQACSRTSFWIKLEQVSLWSRFDTVSTAFNVTSTEILARWSLARIKMQRHADHHQILR